MPTVISVEDLSKSYHLGQIGTGTLSRDLEVWWAKLRGKPNPMLRIGEQDHGNRDGEELWALRDVSFTVQQGEVLGIIGRNGAGKSTLLKILSRVTAPTSGKIKVKGRIASLLEVGTGFHPELTGRENIYLNGAILGMSKQEVTRKFDEIVDFSGVEKFIGTPVKRYSSGMYVRLAFAVAAHLDPEILVVDEVLAVGDAEFQKKCLGKMSEVAGAGRTVLFVSHNLAAISNLCRKSILINKGILLEYGDTHTVINNYVMALSSTNEVERNKQVHIAEIKIFGNSEDLVSSKDIMNIEFNVYFSRPIYNALFHFTLRNLDDLVILQERFIVERVGQKNSGVARVSLKILPLGLLPGGYSCNIKLLGDLDGNDIRIISDAKPITFFCEDFVDISVPGLLIPQGIWKIECEEEH